MKGYKNTNKARIDAILAAFSEEHPDIRNELAMLLPAYNELLNMHALTFEEFALLPIAKGKGHSVESPLFSYDSILPSCPKCQNTKSRRIDENMYVCEKCELKFAANWQSISSGSKCDSVIWLKVLRCILDFYSVSRTCEYCGISRNTYYKIRSKLFYAMMLLMDRVKLYGRIQCDNTFIRASYKGDRLDDSAEYPENSVFDDIDFIPRKARSRGGSNLMPERSINDVCVFTAIDEFGHTIARYVGLGAANSKLILDALGRDRLLLNVPPKDPFASIAKQKVSHTVHTAGIPSILISDKEAAIERFARIYGIQHERHVFRIDNKQKKLPPNAHNIQAVNSVHSRLKNFLRNHHYVSSKYLPGYLVLFEFIENTGASQPAISELFQILAKPGLGKPAEFYNNLFVMPNYLLQWLQYDNPLKRFKYNQLNAFYLYNKRLKQMASNKDDVISVEEIASRCSCSPSTVRRNYKNLQSTGYESLIEKFFEKVEKKTSKGGTMPLPRQAKYSSPLILTIYDEYALERQKPRDKQMMLSEFISHVNQKYQVKLTKGQLLYYFEEIPKAGLRPYLPAVEFTPSKKEFQLTEARRRDIAFAQEFREIEARLRKCGIVCSAPSKIYDELAEKYSIPRDLIMRYVFQGRRYEIRAQKCGVVLTDK